MLTALTNAHASSTFFITGKFVHEHGDCAAEITKYGHEVGNHTWSHLDLTQQSDGMVRDEISKRGARDGRVLKIAAGLGYRSITGRSTAWTESNQSKLPSF